MIKKNVLVVLALIAVLAPSKAKAVTTPYEMGISTPALTAVLLATGAGVLNDVEISSGVATTFCAAFDSATPGSISISGNGDGTAAAPRLGHVNAVATAPAAFASKIGRKFTNGLVLICNVAVHAVAIVSQ